MGETIAYTAQDQPPPAGVPSSFGMDFVDVLLNPAVDGQSLVLEFTGAPGADAEFVVQVWRLMDPGGHAPPRLVSPWVTASQLLMQANTDGVLSYIIPEVDTST